MHDLAGDGDSQAGLAYCLHVTLNRRIAPLGAGIDPAQSIDKFAAVQMLDAYVPTIDGRELRSHPLHPA